MLLLLFRFSWKEKASPLVGHRLPGHFSQCSSGLHPKDWFISHILQLSYDFLHDVLFSLYSRGSGTVSFVSSCFFFFIESWMRLIHSSPSKNWSYFSQDVDGARQRFSVHLLLPISLFFLWGAMCDVRTMRGECWRVGWALRVLSDASQCCLFPNADWDASSQPVAPKSWNWPHLWRLSKLPFWFSAL